MIFALAGTPIPAPVSNSFTLLIEACTNGFIDPGETVTVAFGLKNSGGLPSTNLVATLLAGGGVIPLSGAQVYGALSNSQSLALPFTFIATGSCGASNTATLQLQDGGVAYAPATFTFQLGRSSTVTVNSQSFDGVGAPALPVGWATSSSGTQVNWVTSTNSRDAGANAAFSPASGGAGVNELDSTSITLPHAVEQLSFRQDLALNAPNEGGVLEIQIGSGGTWTDIIAAGGSFLSGGYNSTITSTNNPLAGRAAWSGTTGDFITTAVLLPAAAAGQLIHLRWRCGTGTGAGGLGWYVDTVRVTSSTYACCSAPPQITLQPQDQTVVPGGDVSFSVAADGALPLTYQWLWYGTNLPGALSPTLSLTNVAALAGGPYQAVVSNPGGSVTSAVAELTVLTTTPPPVFGTILPAFGPVGGGNLVTLSGSGFQAGVAVDFGGVWSPSVDWISETEVMAVAPPFPTASLVDVTVANPDGQSGLLAGSYTYGLPPSILAGPTNVFTWVGGTVGFSLTVTGTSPMGFQWQWNGTNLVDSAGVVGSQSNLLVLPAVTAGQAGVYSVVVSNQFGLASSPANLVVVQPALTPVFLSTSSAGGVLNLAWAAYPGRWYQVQALTPALGLVSWVDVGGVTVATNVIAVATEVMGPAAQRYYRVFMLP